MTPQHCPDWVKAIHARLSDLRFSQRELEQEFLNQCARGSSFAIPPSLELANVRDQEGRTGLHLALMNPAVTKETLWELISRCPQLISLRDYDQNLPLDLGDPDRAQ